MKICFFVPVIFFSLLYCNSDESLEECGYYVINMVYYDDLFDPEFFEYISCEEQSEDDSV